MIPTALEFLNDIKNIAYSQEEKLVIFAKLHVKAALEAVVGNAVIKISDLYSEDYSLVRSEIIRYNSCGVHGVYPEECTKHTIDIDEDSVINSYPIDNIK